MYFSHFTIAETVGLAPRQNLSPNIHEIYVYNNSEKDSIL